VRRARLSPDAEVDPSITRGLLEAELALCPLERRGRLIPFSAVLAGTRRLGAERVIDVCNLVVKPKAGDRARRTIPRLASPSALGPLTQRIDQPVWQVVDHLLGQNVSQVVVVATELLDRVLDAVASGPDLLGITKLTLEASPVGSEVSQGSVVHLDCVVQELAGFCVWIAHASEPPRWRYETCELFLVVRPPGGQIPGPGVELIEALQRLGR